MRKPSRFMPPAPKRRAGLLAYIALSAMACAFLYSVWEYPIGTLVALMAFAVVAAISWKSARTRIVQLAARRTSGGGICTFARSFDLHHVDPWVVRAVYEELAGYFKGIGIEVNIDADDELIKDLGIDPEDLDMDIAVNIAARTGRGFEGYTTNPYYAATNTARGLVMFFNCQPRAA